jgi:hypothetical protein
VVKLAANDFDARKARALVLRDRRALLPVLPAVRAALEAWNQSPGVAAIMTWRNALRSVADGFAADLAEAAALSPPAMMIERQVRDLAAEERRDRRYSGKRDADPIYRIEYQVLAKIAGAALYAGPNPNARIGVLIDKLDCAFRVLRLPSDDQTTKDLRAAIHQLREVTDGARELASIYAGAERALEDGALDQIVAWYNHPGRAHRFLTGKGGLERQGRQLVLRVIYDAAHRIQVPDPVAVTRPAILDALEAALLGKLPSPQAVT